MDTLTGHEVIVHFPVSEDDIKWNKKLKAKINDTKAGYYPDSEREPYSWSIFEMWVSGYTQGIEEDRFDFTMQSFYSGAAHYNMDSLKFPWAN